MTINKHFEESTKAGTKHTEMWRKIIESQKPAMGTMRQGDIYGADAETRAIKEACEGWASRKKTPNLKAAI